MEYPCQGGFCEGGCQLTLLWLRDRSHLKSSYFVPYLTHVTKQSFYIAIELDTGILKIVQLLIWI